jgi:hypothetical protein
MNEYKEKIVDALTGKITWRDYTDAEIAKVEAAQAEAQAAKIEAAAKEAARQVLLTKLGITADEAKLLLGGI